MRATSMTSVFLAFAAVASVAAERERILAGNNPDNCNNIDKPPAMDIRVGPPLPGKREFIVYGDSNSDVGRRYMSDNSYQFPDIGPFPWTHLYDAENPEELISIYRRGTATNGAVWPRVLGIPDDQNYATSSGSASEIFRSVQRCKGYTGDNTEDPTGTFDEQINQYLKEHPSPIDPTRGYTHFVALGSNDIKNAARAQQRWKGGIAAGLPNYNLDDPASLTDPVDYSKVFKTEDEKPATEDFEPLVEEAVRSLVTGVGKLLQNGVTGRIMVSNLPSPKDVPVFVASGAADQLDVLVQTANGVLEGELAVNFGPLLGNQVRVADTYTLTKALSENPSIFTDEGFTNLDEACMVPEFYVDSTAEVMGTQNFRQGGQGLEEGMCGDDNVCALCTTSESPCPVCWQGNPTATICDCPNDHVWYDEQHLTAAFNKILARTIYQCSQDEPKTNWPWVKELCGV